MNRGARLIVRNFATATFSLVLLIGSLAIGLHAFQSNAGSNGKPVEAARAHRDLTFKNVAMGEIIDNEATDAGFESLDAGEAKLAFTAFKASDGEGLNVEHGKFRSPDEASRYFHWMIEKRATEILNQGPKLDKTGRVIGVRAEAVVKVRGGASSAIMWTNDEQFFVIFSSSLSDAVELEKRFYR
jgi:hypothetical protein